MNRRSFLRGLSLLGASLGIKLPGKRPAPTETAEPPGMLLDWSDDGGKTWHTSDPWGGGAIGLGGDDWGGNEEAYGPYFAGPRCGVEERTLDIKDYARQIDFSANVFAPSEDRHLFVQKLGDALARAEENIIAQALDILPHA